MIKLIYDKDTNEIEICAQGGRWRSLQYLRRRRKSEMFISLEYDKPIAKRRRPAKYQAEFDAVHEFNASSHTNMLLEYDGPGGARNAYRILKNHIEQARMPLDVKIRDKVFVVVERSKGDANDRG